MSKQLVLEMKGIVKKFPGVIALKGVDFSCKKGEIHALMGENGAGKSTLIKLLNGHSFPTEGKIFFDGKPLEVKNPHQALAQGIAIIYQELNLVRELDAVENIFLGREIKKGIFVDYESMKRETLKILDSMGMQFDVSLPVYKLSIAQQQMVEIAKALSMNTKLLVMDEPTATLTSHEVSSLFQVMHRLKAEGVTIIFISHHLPEVFEICERMTVLKDGELVGSFDLEGMTEERMICLMVGRECDEIFPPNENVPMEEELLRVEGLCSKKVKDVSFVLRKGEILGVAGLVGAGRTELVRAIFGADKVTAGEITLNGATECIKYPKAAIKKGIAFLTEDRKAEGLVLGLSVCMNMTLPVMKKVKRGLFINRKKETKLVEHYIKSLKIATPNKDAKVVNLSGGNQQKVVLGKWLAADCNLIILDEPTRGIDVGAKIEIYNLMRALCKQGKSIIMISSELPEVMGMSDRVLVMRDGRVQAELDNRGPTALTEEMVLQYAMG